MDAQSTFGTQDNGWKLDCPEGTLGEATRVESPDRKRQLSCRLGLPIRAKPSNSEEPRFSLRNSAALNVFPEPLASYFYHYWLGLRIVRHAVRPGDQKRPIGAEFKRPLLEVSRYRCSPGGHYGAVPAIRSRGSHTVRSYVLVYITLKKWSLNPTLLPLGILIKVSREGVRAGRSPTDAKFAYLAFEVDDLLRVAALSSLSEKKGRFRNFATGRFARHFHSSFLSVVRNPTFDGPTKHTRFTALTQMVVAVSGGTIPTTRDIRHYRLAQRQTPRAADIASSGR